MTTEQALLEEMRKNISQMSVPAQQEIEMHASEFRYRAKSNPNALLALCLVGAELAAES